MTRPFLVRVAIVMAVAVCPAAAMTIPAVASAAAVTAGITLKPATVNGVVYVGSYDGSVYALGAATSAQLWSYPTGNSIYSSPAVVNGTVYVGSYNGKLYKFHL